VAFFARRLEELIARASAHDASAPALQAEAVRIVPDALLAEVLDLKIDDVAPEARHEAQSRLMALHFDPNGPEASRILGLYATLADEATDAERETMRRNVRQALDADQPDTRSRAAECLAKLLPRLEGRKREGAFRDLVDKALDDGDASVRIAAGRALRMVARSLTPEEREEMESEGVPSLGELQ
jgi:hypothetical protein